MLGVGNTALGSGGSLSLDVRAAFSASVLATNSNASAETPAATADVALSLPNLQVPAVPVYNAFEFIYRTDFGKIILREQNVETGQEVTQIPSEYHLQQYAATQRAQRIQQEAKLLHVQAGSTQPHAGTGTKTTAPTGTTGKSAAPSASSDQGAPAPAPVPQAAAPAAPAVTAAPAAAPAHVDIKV